MPSAAAATSDVTTRKTFDLYSGEPERKHMAVRREDGAADGGDGSGSDWVVGEDRRDQMILLLAHYVDLHVLRM